MRFCIFHKNRVIPKWTMQRCRINVCIVNAGIVHIIYARLRISKRVSSSLNRSSTLEELCETAIFQIWKAKCRCLEQIPDDIRWKHIHSHSMYDWPANKAVYQLAATRGGARLGLTEMVAIIEATVHPLRPMVFLMVCLTSAYWEMEEDGREEPNTSSMRACVWMADDSEDEMMTV